MRREKEALGEWQERIVSVSQQKRLGYHTNQAERAEWETRLRVRIMWVMAIIVLTGVVTRLVYLQVFEAGQKLLLSQNNHIEQIRLPATRGEIRDRNGIVLAKDNNNGREYPLGMAGVAIVGYMSEVTESELGCRQGICYTPGMWTGRAGVEKMMEIELKGRDGGVIEEVDAGGKAIRERGKNESEPGGNVELTIDAKLQQIMYTAMQDKFGAAVAVDMQGKVIGLVTTPTYDPANVVKYLKDTEKPYFLNKATSGVYPPGSVFKLVTAYAGLAAGVIDAETKVEDTGELRVGEYRYGNWYFDQYGRTEGEVGLTKALARSNDIYFYKIGEWMGINKLVAEAKRFGYGEVTGIELPGEVKGLVPDPLWKERRTGEKWFLGNTYHMAIGQGDLLVTPAQVARATLGAVTGRLCKLSVLKNSRTQCVDLGLKTGDIETVKEGMREACAAGGVAYPFFDFQPYVICKTGTAQHAGQKTEEDLPHAWITVAYPGENPEMILTVFVEAGGEGSAVAAPIAKQILNDWKNTGK